MSVDESTEGLPSGRRTNPRDTSGSQRVGDAESASRGPTTLTTALISVIGGLGILSRSVSAVFHPYFWAESGAIFYSDAWNHGLAYLLKPYAGYPVLLTRTLSEVTVQFPLNYGPAIFLFFSLIVQIIPITILVSKRFAAIIKPLWIRIGLSAIYVALPNSSEVNLHFVSMQWQLALIAFLILISPTPNGRSGKVVESIGLVLAGLSGPFAILLVPIAVVLYLSKKDSRQTLYRQVLLILCALVDGITYLATIHSARIGAHGLGASFNVLIRLLGGQVVIGGLFGMRGYTHVLSFSWGNIAIISAGIFFIIVTIYILAKAPLQLRLLQVYALLIFSASLISPQISFTAPQWVVMLSPGAGNRYFYFPILTFIVALTWLISHFYLKAKLDRDKNGLKHNRSLIYSSQKSDRNSQFLHSARSRSKTPTNSKPKRTISGGLLVFFSIQICTMALIGVPLDWEFPSYTSTNLTLYQSKLASPRKGTVTIPIEPKGVVMVLDKK